MDNDDGKAPQDQGDERGSQITVTNDDLARERAQTKRDNDRQDKQARRREKVTLWVAIAGVLIAAASTGISWVQWDLMRQQLSDARKASKEQNVDVQRALIAFEKQAAAMTESVGPSAKEQAKASTDAATAMKDAATANKIAANNSGRIARSSESGIDATRESLRLEQRAWVGVKGTKDIMFEADKRAGATLVVVNSGRTPALKLHGQIVLEYLPVGAEPFSNWPPSKVGALASTQVLNPDTDSSMIRYTELPITAKDAEEIRLRHILVYIRAKIIYEDIFRQWHETTYCGRLNEDRTAFEYCQEGNAAN